MYTNSYRLQRRSARLRQGSGDEASGQGQTGQTGCQERPLSACRPCPSPCHIGFPHSIAFFAEKVRRVVPGNFTFVVMTDREDLDDQIFRTFVGCGIADEKTPRAASGKVLKSAPLRAARTKCLCPAARRLSSSARFMGIAFRSTGGCSKRQDALPWREFVGVRLLGRFGRRHEGATAG
jgi:hypothetical protein